VFILGKKSFLPEPADQFRSTLVEIILALREFNQVYLNLQITEVHK
jgi:hypothetical protein